MIHDGHTKIIARLHKQFSPRALNIYNPYFEEVGLNAAFILFHNPDPKPLIHGIKDLNFAGAVTVGFETDPEFTKLVDDFDDTSTNVNRIGFIKNVDGRLKGFYQGGQGILFATQNAISLDGKEIVLIGSGNVVRSLLFEIQKRDVKTKKITILNRTVEKLTEIQSEYSVVNDIGGLDKLKNITGDILINASHIGSSQPDVYFTKEIIGRFQAVSDVTFETENTNLINLAKKLGLKLSTGWDMFTYQGLIVLETILDIKIDPVILKKHVVSGLTRNVK